MVSSEVYDFRVGRVMRVLKPVFMQRFGFDKFNRSAALIRPMGYCFADDAGFRISPQFDGLWNVRFCRPQGRANVVFG